MFKHTRGVQEPVKRPYYVKVKATNEKGEEFILEGEELMARAVFHENDHLWKIIYRLCRKNRRNIL